MRKNRQLKHVGKILGLCLLLMVCSATTAFALEAAPTPKLAFAVNSPELWLFHPKNLPAATPLKNVLSIVEIEEDAYIPIRAFCDALGYRIEGDPAGALVISKNGKKVTLSQIQRVADLNDPNNESTYFSLNGKGYTKVKNFAEVENLQIIAQEGVYLLYQLPAPLGDRVTPTPSGDSVTPTPSAGSVTPTPSGDSVTPTPSAGSVTPTPSAGKVTPASSDEVDEQVWDTVLTKQGDFFVLNSQFVQNLKKNVIAPSEDWLRALKKVYDDRYYAPFVNPYVAYSYPQMMADIEKLKLQYPEYITTASAGKSVEGRDLITVEFGRGPKQIYVLGSHHAREYMSTSYIMYFVNQTAYGAKTGNNTTRVDLVNLLNSVTYHIMPMVNPDGVNLVQNGLESVSPALREQVRAMPIVAGSQYGYKAWKTNINGVDLNRNYPSNWDALKTRHKGASAFYPGPYAASEPETQAVMNYLDMYPSAVVVSMHTQGQWLYWSNPAGELGEMGRRMLASSGFRSEENTRKESKGGFLSNYARDVRQMYEMTIELCNYVGPYPYPDAQFDEAWYPAREMLLIVGDEVAKQ